MKRTAILSFLLTLSFSAAAQELRPIATVEMPATIENAVTCNQGSQIFGVDADGNLYLWTLPAVAPRKLRPASDGVASHIMCSANGKSVAVAGKNGHVYILDTQNAQVSHELKTSGAIRDLSVSADGALIAVASHGAPAELWDVRAERKLASGKTTMSGSAAVTISPDGSMFVSADEDTIVRAYDGTGKKLFESDAGTLEPFTANFSPDGKAFSVAGAEGSVMLFDARSGKRISASATRGNPIFASTMAPDGKRLCVLEMDDFSLRPVSISIWDTQARDLKPLAVDPKTVVGAGQDKSHLLLLRAESTQKMTVLSVQ